MKSSIELSLRKSVTPEYVFGLNARSLAGKYAKNLGCKNVLLVTDLGVKSTPWYADVTNSLASKGIAYTCFDDIVPNPRDFSVAAGAQCYMQHNCDGIVSIGGGSPMDCAKGIGIVVSNDEDILAFEGVDKIKMPLPPLICIPTTAGSSADVSQFAIITDTKRKVKIAIISKSIVPDAALIDPETTLSMDADLTIHTGLDALTHAIEAYVSNAYSNITDLHALEAIKLLYASLPNVAKNLEDIQARGSVMMASLLAGLSFSNASLGAVHAMAHALGGRFDLPHGLCNALLLDKVVAYNLPYAKSKYEQISNTFGLKEVQALPEKIADFKASLGLTGGLSQFDITDKDFDNLSKLALKDACIVTNPQIPSDREVTSIYAQSL